MSEQGPGQDAVRGDRGVALDQERWRAAVPIPRRTTCLPPMQRVWAMSLLSWKVLSRS